MVVEEDWCLGEGDNTFQFSPSLYSGLGVGESKSDSGAWRSYFEQALSLCAGSELQRAAFRESSQCKAPCAAWELPVCQQQKCPPVVQHSGSGSLVSPLPHQRDPTLG